MDNTDDTVAWTVDLGEIAVGTVYIAAVIAHPQDSPPQQPGVVGPAHTVGITADRMVDLLASQLVDEFWRPQRVVLHGEMSLAPTPADVHAISQRLSALNRIDFPYTIYANLVSGITREGRSVLGIIVFYTKKEYSNGNGQGTPTTGGVPPATEQP